MAAELGLLSLTQLQKLAQQQHQMNNSDVWTWSRKQGLENKESWEVSAFEKDTESLTESLIGATWPPRSYTCSFCRREFRSAQALGGHMNVHRRDRARLRQPPPGKSHHSPSSPLILESLEFAANHGLGIFYPAPTPSLVFSQTMESSPYTGNNGLMPQYSPAINFFKSTDIENSSDDNTDGSVTEELDLELRLGW